MNWTLIEKEQKVLDMKLKYIVRDRKTVVKNNAKRNGKDTMEIRQDIQDRYKSQFKKSYEHDKLVIKHKSNDWVYVNNLFSTNPVLEISMEHIPQKRNPNKKNNGLINLDNLEALALENYSKFDGEAVLYIPERLNYVKVSMPIGRVPYHIIHKTCKAIGYKYYHCNPTLNREGINDFLNHIFTQYCDSPRENFEYDSIALEEITNFIFKNNPKPKQSKTKFLYNPDYELTKAEKKSEENRVQGNSKTKCDCEKINSFLKTESITNQQIADCLGMSLSTFKRKKKICK
jgi:hypothetical protein